ncbi:hypothetical protein [Thiolinea disciformis]|uniref:hypothetical protein n=1 Tax=Thiolinea disciformis TaxID=125614 RepID=UPI00036DBF22|nr:hypothetical protein [Thiolinea disciformis]
MLSKSLALLGCMALLLSACDSHELTVKRLAQQRWEALIAGRLEEAYRFYTDAFQSTTTLDQFKKTVRGVGFWQQAEIQKVQCESKVQRCIAEVKVTVVLKMRGITEPIKTSDMLQEVWVKQAWLSDWRYIKD